ncbi:uncharacterized protein LAESUDRAFT_76253 [Laetiporus sulphureus 93-53]|uniref:Uncharacterized protein n=1 Tax=Laetiporus sulphureus 93-53 TaxID=1314785 RepID=A0A165F0P4_9APHY|nr:uncharacterized protein LAESUDRAFT_76253 [Laetiporus sulphureus 93-53]KZT08117.1 hypothetical protein LAESUDRAFT_76253 [Laetiporus sulphureus 93-53]
MQFTRARLSSLASARSMRLRSRSVRNAESMVSHTSSGEVSMSCFFSLPQRRVKMPPDTASTTMIINHTTLIMSSSPAARQRLDNLATLQLLANLMCTGNSCILSLTTNDVILRMQVVHAFVKFKDDSYDSYAVSPESLRLLTVVTGSLCFKLNVKAATVEIALEHDA